MEREKLSACLITFNEEKNLGDCLESIAGLADEIVIVDSGSTDLTEEIARRYGARIAVHPFDDFGRQKQRAIDLATHPWILLIDADERVSGELSSEISQLLQDRSRLERNQGYEINRLNFFMGKAILHGGWSPDYLVRLFRKGQARISENLVHESVHVSGTTGRLVHRLCHFTYASMEAFIQKNARYARLSALEKKSRGSAPGLLKVLLHPPFVFIKMYLFRQGFRDGKEGLFLAILYSYYTSLKYIWQFYL